MKRRTGGKTGEEEVEKVEEHQFVGDGGAGLLSGPGLRSSLQRWKKNKEGARGGHEIGRRGGEEGAGGDCVEEATGVDRETSVGGMRKYLQELKRRNSARAATIQGQAGGGEVKQEDHFRKKFRQDVPVGPRGGPSLCEWIRKQDSTHTRLIDLRMFLEDVEAGTGGFWKGKRKRLWRKRRRVGIVRGSRVSETLQTHDEDSLSRILCAKVHL